MAQKSLSRASLLLTEVAKLANPAAHRGASHLLSVLHDYFPGLTVHVFEVKGRQTTPVDSDVALSDIAVEADVNACLSDRKAVVKGSGDAAIRLYPVVVNDSPAMLVAATGRAPRRSDPDELAVLVRIYGNVLSLVQESERDTLTGLYNRRVLERRLPELITGLRSLRRRVSDHESVHFALLDLDRFKAINDKYGHLYGDEVLLIFSGLMKQSFRATDLLVRYGGEEFIVVLIDTSLESCNMVLERFRGKVEEYAFPQIGRVTVSIGAVRISGESLPSTVLDQADQALYFAKAAGRNRVCTYDKLVAEGLISPQLRAGNTELFEAEKYRREREDPA